MLIIVCDDVMLIIMLIIVCDDVMIQGSPQYSPPSVSVHNLQGAEGNGLFVLLLLLLALAGELFRLVVG